MSTGSSQFTEVKRHEYIEDSKATSHHFTKDNGAQHIPTSVANSTTSSKFKELHKLHDNWDNLIEYVENYGEIDES